METEAYVESFTEAGNPLYITIKLYLYQDESINTGKLFWTYDILKISGHGKSRGETFEYECENGQYDDEIKAACEAELQSYIKAA